MERKHGEATRGASAAPLDGARVHKVCRFGLSAVLGRPCGTAARRATAGGLEAFSSWREAPLMATAGGSHGRDAPLMRREAPFHRPPPIEAQKRRAAQDGRHAFFARFL